MRRRSRLYIFPIWSQAANQPARATGIAVANLSGSSATLTFTAYDKAGRVLSGSNVTNPASVQLAPGEQNALVDTRLFGTGVAALNSVGWVKLESTVREISGSFLTFDRSLTVLDGADATLSPMTRICLARAGGPGVNPGPRRESEPRCDRGPVRTGRYGRRRPSSASRTVDGSGALVEPVSDLFPGATLLGSSYIRATSEREVVAFEYLARPERYAEAVNGLDATGGGTRLYSPQYVVGGAWRSTLSVVNLDSSPGTVTFRFVGDDGNPIGSPRQLAIAPRGKLHITDQEFFSGTGGIRQGYVEIVTSGVRIMGTVEFGDPDRNVFSAALPLVNASQKQMVFSQVASDATYFTGIAIVNPRENDVSVNIQVFDSRGAQLASATEVVIRKGRSSKVLTELFPSLAGVNVSSGYIALTADDQVGSFALYGTHTLSVLSAINAQSRPR